MRCGVCARGPGQAESSVPLQLLRGGAKGSRTSLGRGFRSGVVVAVGCWADCLLTALHEPGWSLDSAKRALGNFPSLFSLLRV